MTENAGIRISYEPVYTYNYFQDNYPGSQSVVNRREWWAGYAAADGAITASCVFGEFLFVCGSFTHLGAKSRAGFGAISLVDGTVSDAWNIAFTGGNPTAVATDGFYLYLGGSFNAVGAVTTVAGSAVNGLLRWDYSGVLDTTWNPAPNASPAIICLVYNETNDSMLVGSQGLTTLGGVAGFVKCAEVSCEAPGTPTAWKPAPNGDVYALAYVAGQTYPYYVAGQFANLGSTPVAVGNLGRTTAAGVADSTYLPAGDGAIVALAVDGAQVYAGGYFNNVGGAARNFLAKLDYSGVATAFNPNPSAKILSLLLWRGLLFMGGDFTTIGGVSYIGVACYDTVGAAMRADWNPKVTGSADVATLAQKGKTLLLGGGFTGITTGSGGSYMASVPWPIFISGTNTKYVAKTGSDAAAGTSAAPYLTIAYAISQMSSSYRYVVIQDSGTYNEQITTAVAAGSDCGIYAADGFIPTVRLARGAYAGTFGARPTGRTKFYAGSAANIAYVSKQGVTGTKGNVNLPFPTIALALAACSTGDCIQIQDSATYDEAFTGASSIGINITIQAANGQTPTWTTSAGTIMISSQYNLSLYGLTISLPPSNTLVALNVAGGTSKTVEFYDCSYSGYKSAFLINGGTTPIVTLSGNIFANTSGPAIDFEIASANYTSTNNYFNSCGYNNAAGDVVVVGSISWTETYCTHFNSAGQFGLYVSAGSAAGAQTQTVSNCSFIGLSSPSNAGGIYHTAVNGTAKVLNVTNCLFNGLGGYAICVFNCFGNSTFTGSLSYNCMRNSVAQIGGKPAQVYVYTTGGQTITVSNFVFVGTYSMTGCSSLRIDEDATTWPAMTSNLSNLAFINAPGFAIYCLPGNTGNQWSGTWTGIVEMGSVYGHSIGFGIKPATYPTLSYSVLSVPLSAVAQTAVTIGSRVLYANPQFVSTDAGTENAALGGASPASTLNRGATYPCDSGPANPTWQVTANAAVNFTIDGVNIAGDTNFQDGMLLITGATGKIFLQHCTATGLANCALRTAGTSIGGGAYLGVNVNNCTFVSLNGKGAELTDGTPTVRNCVFDTCGSVGIYNAAGYATITNNTVYGCGYGLLEIAFSLCRNNVLSGSSIDYHGQSVQLNSDVELTDSTATFTLGTRLNPLFISVNTPHDLRLEHTGVGSPTTSPAVALGSDGHDAGAYTRFYGPATVLWTTIDFDTAGWRNPGQVEWSEVLVFPTEVDLFGGDMRSEASAVRKQHRLTWDGATDMPAAQVLALIDLYTNPDGQCLLSLDNGTTLIPVRLVRSEMFSWTQLSGLPYSDDGIPTPVGSLSFRESN